MAPRISLLFPAPAIEQLSQETHLFNVVLTLGLRATAGKEAQHATCIAETRRSLREATTTTAGTAREWDDLIHARIHLAVWYNDASQWRQAYIESHEGGLTTYWIEARKSRLACDARMSSEESPHELEVSERFRLWTSVCATDNWQVDRLATRNDVLLTGPE